MQLVIGLCFFIPNLSVFVTANCIENAVWHNSEKNLYQWHAFLRILNVNPIVKTIIVVGMHLFIEDSGADTVISS